MSIDYRSRPARRVLMLEPKAFFEHQWPGLISRNARLAAEAAVRANVPPLTLEVAGGRWTLVPESASVRVVEGGEEGGLRVRLELPAFAALVDDQRSTLGLSVAGRAEVVGGAGADFIAWDTVLRAALDGRPAFAPGMIRITTAAGGPLDLSQRFRAGADPLAMRDFLRSAGFLCIEGLFRPDEMSGIAGDLDRAAGKALPGDGTSWWVRTTAGEHRPSRILNFLEQSERLATLLHDERFLGLAAVAGEGHVHSDSFGEHFSTPSAEGLIKACGVTEGISDLGWHKDCARGGHSRFCCGLTVGIAVTDADEESGELRVVAGSHRANLPGAGLADDVDLPVVSLPTKAGDVTLHCSCTLHEARPPRSRERKVVYTGFGLPPKFEDDVPAVNDAALARERARIGDMD